MRKRSLRLENLESRQALSGWGNPWPEPERLTISFAPDGAEISGRENRLFDSLDQAAEREVWQSELLRAFQTWAEHANINFSLVDDNGLPFGIATPAQGSPHWGDIRIGAASLSHSELAVASPFDLFNDWSGDIVLNSDYRFEPDGAGGFDLFTVALQEAGHALSLPNSDEATSAMFTAYQGARTDLAPGDIASIQALYGGRRSDRFDAAMDNGVRARSTPLQFVFDYDQLGGGDGTAGPTPFVAVADLTSRSDIDYYQFDLPAELNDFHVELRASGISLLNARISVYDANGQFIAGAESAGVLDLDVSLSVSGATPGSRYYVRVDGASANPFAVGAYHLAVGKEAHEALFPSLPEFIDDDRGDDDDDDLGGLIDLEPNTTTVGPLWDATYRASISFTADSDYYRIVAPDAITNSTALQIAVWGLETDKLDARAEVFADPEFVHALQPEVLRSDADAMVLQLHAIVAGQSYYVRIGASDPQGSAKIGNYLLGADFRAAPVRFATLATTFLNAVRPAHDIPLLVGASQVHHLRLAVGALSLTEGVQVEWTILDASQNVITSLIVAQSTPRTVTALLPPGQYTMRLRAFVPGLSRLPNVSVRITGVIVSDPIGPTLRNPIQNPVFPMTSLDLTKKRWTTAARPPRWLAPRPPMDDPRL